MTLFHEIQRLLEHTYGVTGVNFEEFILNERRSAVLCGLADSSAKQVSDLGRLFMRVLVQLKVARFTVEGAIHGAEAVEGR